MSSSNQSSLPYHESDITTILTLSSFLLLLNVVNHVLDRLLFCGLIGQVLLGAAFGSPGAKLLSLSTQESIVQLGYLGLILLVYEGGLSTSFTALRSNLLLSAAVAVTGIGAPMALSFTLKSLLGATTLQAFAAGAALCSTSLGTTFTVLKTSGLTSTRLGVVLSSAAMMDDVVGLVVVQVISNLGSAAKSEFVSPATIVRPIIVSLGFAFALPLICCFVVKPATLWTSALCDKHPQNTWTRALAGSRTAAIIHTGILLGMVTGATYAGTSSLFAAYLAGSASSWWDAEFLPRNTPDAATTTDPSHQSSAEDTSNNINDAQSQDPDPNAPQETRASSDISAANEVRYTAESTFDKYYRPPVESILKPMFFASIGFSIPLTDMFAGRVVRNGLIYAVLMAFGKLVCGLWLVRFSGLPVSYLQARVRTIEKRVRKMLPRPKVYDHSQNAQGASATQKEHTEVKLADSTERRRDVAQQIPPYSPSSPTSDGPPRPQSPLSLYPAAILGTAMVARGEIGFLVSALANSEGVFSAQGQDVFLVVTWAIVLCTVLGPVGVGVLIRRVRGLERVKEGGPGSGGGGKVLGVWM